MTKEITLPPSKIRFMHNRINSRFSDGRSLNETVEEIEEGLMDVYDLPLIRVVRRNGFYYAFDNRRLYVYRVLQYRGHLDTVRVKLAPLSNFQPARFTTTNNGKSVEFQLGYALPHAEATSPASSPETSSESEDEDDWCDMFQYLNMSDDCLYDYESEGYQLDYNEDSSDSDEDDYYPY